MNPLLIYKEYKENNGVKYHNLKTVAVQHTQSIIIDRSLITDNQEKIASSERFFGKKEDPNFVCVDDTRRGEFLVSDSFGPCQAVVARLTNGEAVLLHARNTIGKSLDLFIESIVESQAEVQDVLVFQKEANKQNKAKGPIMAFRIAIALYKELQKHNKVFDTELVKRIPMDNYRCIVVDAKNNKIVLANEIEYFPEQAMDKTSSAPVMATGLINTIGMEQTLKDIKEEQKLDSSLVIPDFMKKAPKQIQSTKNPGQIEEKKEPSPKNPLGFWKKLKLNLKTKHEMPRLHKPK